MMCVNVKTSSLHCGSCETPCTPGSLCSDGMCVNSCPAGQTACTDSTDGGAGNYCATFTTDNQNCGGCGWACGPSQRCSNGVCS
jgi:hypothetical protein